MQGSLYRTIIKDALQLSWKNKFLWVFGLFAAVVGNGGEYEIFYKAIGVSSSGITFPTLGALYANNIFSFNALGNFFSRLFSQPLSFFLSLVGIAIFLLLVVLVIWLTCISQAALVYGADRLGVSKKTLFSDAYIEGKKYFVSVLGLNVIYYAVIAIVLSIVGLPAYLVFFSAQNTLAVWFYLLNFFVFLPLAIIVSFVIKYALAYVVLKKQKFLDALYLGLKLFTKNWLISLEMVFVIFLIDVVFGLGTLVAMVLVALPFIIFGLFLSYFGVAAATTIMYILSLVFVFVVLMVVGMFVTTLQYTAWTFLFNRLTKEGGFSKLIRLFYHSKN